MSNQTFEQKVGAAFVGGMRAKYNELCAEVKGLAEMLKKPVKTVWDWLSEGSETAAPVAPKAPNLNGTLRVREETTPGGGQKYSYSQLAPFVSQAVLAIVKPGKTKSFTTTDVNRSLGNIIPKSGLDRRYTAALVKREFKGLKVIKPGAKGGTEGTNTFQLLKGFGPKTARSYTPPSNKKAEAKKRTVTPQSVGYTYPTFQPVVLTALQRFLEGGVTTFTSLDLRQACVTVMGEKAIFQLNWPGAAVKGFKIAGLTHTGTLPHPTAVNKRIIQYQFTDPVAARVALAALLEKYPLKLLSPAVPATGGKTAGFSPGGGRTRRRV